MLLNGDFDEEGSHKSFLEARQEFLQQKVSCQEYEEFLQQKVSFQNYEDDYEEYLQGKTIFMPNEVKVIKKYKDDDEFWKRIDSMLKGDRNKLNISLTDDIFVTMNGDQVYRRQVGSITFYTFTMPSKDIQPNLDKDEDDDDDEDDDEDEDDDDDDEDDE
jgi:hypothetical protein